MKYRPIRAIGRLHSGQGKGRSGTLLSQFDEPNCLNDLRHSKRAKCALLVADGTPDPGRIPATVHLRSRCPTTDAVGRSDWIHRRYGVLVPDSQVSNLHPSVAMMKAFPFHFNRGAHHDTAATPNDLRHEAQNLFAAGLRVKSATVEVVVPAADGPLSLPPIRMKLGPLRRLVGQLRPRLTQRTPKRAPRSSWPTCVERWWCSTSGGTGAGLASGRCHI